MMAHGVGHVMAVLPVLLDTPDEWHTGSWLLDRLLGSRASAALGMAGGMALLVAFVLAGLSLGGWGVTGDWWRGTAAVAGTAGLVWLLLYWNSLATLFNKLGAIAVDVGAIVLAADPGRFLD